jgi:hypothetical protein
MGIIGPIEFQPIMGICFSSLIDTDDVTIVGIPGIDLLSDPGHEQWHLKERSRKGHDCAVISPKIMHNPNCS